MDTKKASGFSVKSLISIIESRAFKAIAPALIVGVLLGAKQYSDAGMVFAAFHFYYLLGERKPNTMNIAREHEHGQRRSKPNP